MSTIQRECNIILYWENNSITLKYIFLCHSFCAHVYGPCQQFFSNNGAIQRECNIILYWENNSITLKYIFLCHSFCAHVYGPCQQFFSNNGAISCLPGLN